MIEEPMSRSLLQSEAENGSLDVGGAKLNRGVVLSIFKETFEASSVELTASTDGGGSTVSESFSQWFKGML